MRFAHVSLPGSATPQLVTVDDDGAAVVSLLFDGAPATLNALIEGGDELLERVRTTALNAPRVSLEGAVYGPAVPRPPVILAVGLNYAAHSSELGLKTDTAPTVLHGTTRIFVNPPPLPPKSELLGPGNEGGGVYSGIGP